MYNTNSSKFNLFPLVKCCRKVKMYFFNLYLNVCNFKFMKLTGKINYSIQKHCKKKNAEREVSIYC